MGRSFWFECARCGYRAKVSGCADRGYDFAVQTIVCRDCTALHDAVTRIRVPVESNLGLPKIAGLRPLKPLNQPRAPVVPPTFQAALNRLPQKAVGRFKWLRFKVQCPVSPIHRVESWNEPGKCPKCGLHLEKNALPYRIWD